MKALVNLQGMNFIIPSQQRGYKWTKQNIDELIEDFRDFIKKGKAKKVYCLQPLAVVPVPEDSNSFVVIDGQQRLTTLFLLFKAVFGEEWYSFKYERDESCEDDKVSNRWSLLKNIQNRDEDKSTIDTFFITKAFHEIKDYYSKLSDIERENLKQLLKANRSEKSVQVIWYEVDESKSHTTFQNLNSGKIPLSNTELIKALFLNRSSGLVSGREQVATLFEEMEQMMSNDSFWYMFNSEEQREGQSRLDFIFNLVAGCSTEDYKVDPRWSFRNYFYNNAEFNTKNRNEGKENLVEKWRKVRNTFLRLKDMYEDPYIYHYVGFLTYCKEKGAEGKEHYAKKLLSWSYDKKKSEFIKELKSQISTIIKNQNKYNSLSEYNYSSGPYVLRRLFLLYNIETILFHYQEIKNNTEFALTKLFERFPFELLHKQKWDIEHIASKTENDFSNPKDREDWLASIKEDLGEKYSSIDCSEQECKYKKTLKKDDFDRLYKKIMEYCEGKLGEDVIPDVVTDETIRKGRKDKDQIGNLTLLDSHTNRSFKNALFPRKRRIILVAGGIQSKDEEDKEIQRVFIPFCTKQCFTKAYRRTSNVNLNAWTQSDADAYYDDIELKLGKYF